MTTSSNVSQDSLLTAAAANGTVNKTDGVSPALKNAKRRVYAAISKNKQGSDDRPAQDEKTATVEAVAWARRRLIRGFTTHTDREAFCSFLNELEAPYKPAPNAKPVVRGMPKRPKKDVKARREPLSVKEIKKGLSKGSEEDVLAKARGYVVVLMNEIRLTMEGVGVRLTAVEEGLVERSRKLLPERDEDEIRSTISAWMDMVIEANRKPWLGRKRDRYAREQQAPVPDETESKDEAASESEEQADQEATREAA